MADNKSPEHPLEVLPAMLNLVLIQTGKLLRDSNSHNPRAFGYTRNRVNEYVPPANKRFHEALDEIEIKIMDARAVIERDLSVMRKKRAERLGVNLVSKASSPLMGNTLDMGQAGDVDLFGEQIAVADMAALDMAAVENGVVNGQGMPQDGKNSAGLAISIPVASGDQDVQGQEKVSKDAENTDNGSAAVQDQPDQGVNVTDFDFDSMFNDLEFTADGSMNFDMDFSTTDAANQGLLADGAFGNMAMPGTNSTNNASSNNEDINSLFPGLESAINAPNEPPASGDNAAASAPGASATATVTANDKDQANTQKQTQSDSQPQDALGVDFTMDDTNFGNLGDFDFEEEWLKM